MRLIHLLTLYRGLYGSHSCCPCCYIGPWRLLCCVWQLDQREQTQQRYSVSTTTTKGRWVTTTRDIEIITCLRQLIDTWNHVVGFIYLRNHNKYILSYSFQVHVHIIYFEFNMLCLNHKRIYRTGVYDESLSYLANQCTVQKKSRKTKSEHIHLQWGRISKLIFLILVTVPHCSRSQNALLWYKEERPVYR